MRDLAKALLLWLLVVVPLPIIIVQYVVGQLVGWDEDLDRGC